MMPLLAPGVTFHSSSSSKSSNFSRVTMSGPCPPATVFNTPSSTFHELPGKEFVLNPRHLSRDFPSNRVSHLPGRTFASPPLSEMKPDISERRTIERISLVWLGMVISVLRFVAVADRPGQASGCDPKWRSRARLCEPQHAHAELTVRTLLEPPAVRPRCVSQRRAPRVCRPPRHSANRLRRLVRRTSANTNLRLAVPLPRKRARVHYR